MFQQLLIGSDCYSQLGDGLVLTESFQCVADCGTEYDGQYDHAQSGVFQLFVCLDAV